MNKKNRKKGKVLRSRIAGLLLVVAALLLAFSPLVWSRTMIYAQASSDFTDFPPLGEEECWDGIDNDEDGWIDWLPIPFDGMGDPDCAVMFDDNEGTDTPPPTPEEQCSIDGGFWDGEECDEVPTCTGNQEYNSHTNQCDEVFVPPVCAENQHLEGEGEDAHCVDNEVTPPGDDEEESTPPPATPPSSGGGGGGGGGGVVSGPLSIGFINTNPQGGGGTTLGTSTAALPLGCTPYLNSYLHIGRANNVEEVEKLQTFLNQHMGENLPVTGHFGPLTFDAVRRFQQKYTIEVLKPWMDAGLMDSLEPTGYVYKTTTRMINMLSCGAGVVLPMPQLP